MPSRLTPITVVALFAIGCSSSPAVDDPDAPPAELPDEFEDVEADATDEEDGDYVVQFRDRHIDLYPYVQGFPYSSLMPVLEAEYMLYFETTPDGMWLRHVELDADGDDVELTEGRLVNDVDWATRSFRRGIYNRHLDRFFFMGDEQNDEYFNVYSLDVDSGKMELHTDVDYIYGYGFSDDHRKMGYVVRHGESEPFNSCLHVRDLDSGDDQEIWCDEGGEDRLTWTAIDFSDDADSLVVRMQHDLDRNRTNIGRFDLNDPGPPQLLLERGLRHLTLSPVSDTYDGERLLFISAKRGINDFYRLDVEEGDFERITELEQDITFATILEKEDKPPLLLTLLTLPYGTIVEVRDPDDGELLWSELRSDRISLRDDHKGRAVFVNNGVANPFTMEFADLHLHEGFPSDADDESAVSLDVRQVASISEELAETLVQCEVERVEFPTFDEVDGETRMIHAYLYEPVDPPADDARLARVTAFYGGNNVFNFGHHIMCAAGITTFSPAPRGSRGFGAEFAALNDGDLGGDDIIDLFYAARWLEANLDLRPWQIGVYGGSHGGYATMRALTFPPETNERDESYDFGFGMSHAGISDLLHFYDTSNIPDWLVLLAGDPETEPDRLRERSPLTHVDRLGAPLLLTHGSQDRRVPVDESRRFFEAASEYGLPVVYEEFDGQGHGIVGLENRLRFYRATFDFLEDHVLPRVTDRN